MRTKVSGMKIFALKTGELNRILVFIQEYRKKYLSKFYNHHGTIITDQFTFCIVIHFF